MTRRPGRQRGTPAPISQEELDWWRRNQGARVRAGRVLLVLEAAARRFAQNLARQEVNLAERYAREIAAWLEQQPSTDAARLAAQVRDGAWLPDEEPAEAPDAAQEDAGQGSVPAVLPRPEAPAGAQPGGA